VVARERQLARSGGSRKGCTALSRRWVGACGADALRSGATKKAAA